MLSSTILLRSVGQPPPRQGSKALPVRRSDSKPEVMLQSESDSETDKSTVRADSLHTRLFVDSCPYLGEQG